MCFFVLLALSRAEFQDDAGLIYDNEDRTVLTGYNDTVFTGALLIPDTVVSIAADAFKDCTKLGGDLLIGNKVEVIGANAFKNAGSLETIKIQSSVKTIETGAFSSTTFKRMEIDADGLTIEGDGINMAGSAVVITGVDVTLKEDAINDWRVFLVKDGSITITGERFVFEKHSIYAPHIAIDVNDSTFAAQTNQGDHQYGYQSFTISGDNNVFGPGAIGSSSYSNIPNPAWVSLTRVQCSDSLGSFTEFQEVNVTFLTVGQSALSGAQTAEKVNIGFCEGCTTIPAGSFKKLPITGPVYFPASVTSIDPNAFDGSTGITAFVFHQANSVYSTADGVLLDSAGKSIILFPPGKTGSFTIPATLTTLPTIDEHIFEKLESLVVHPDNPNFFSGNGVLMSKETGMVLVCPKGLSQELVIPNEATGIGPSAFKGCKKLTKVTINENVKTISNGAFFEAVFGSVKIKASTLSIETEAFKSTEGTLEIFGDSITIHKYGAYMSALAGSLTIYGTKCHLMSLSCMGASMDINVNNSTLSGDGTKYNGITHYLNTGEYAVKILIKGEGNILDNAPITCQSKSEQELTNYVVDLRNSKPNGNIGYISGFGSVYFSFESLAPYTLIKDSIRDCTSVEFVIRDTVTVIPRHCFYEATYLTSVKIPGSVNVIERDAFRGCSKITAFEVEGDNFAVQDGVVYDKAITTCSVSRRENWNIQPSKHRSGNVGYSKLFP